jgi:hypothetical protein
MDMPMKHSGNCANLKGPKLRPRHYSYDPSVDEPATLLEQEDVDIEGETPTEDTEPIEQMEPENRSPGEHEN